MIKNAKIHGTQVKPADYFRFGIEGGNRGDRNYMMSRSDLMEFNNCPHRWLKGYKQGNTSALSYGQMVDTIVLDNKNFMEWFIIQPKTYVNDKEERKEWNNRSNTCKAWNVETLKSGKQIISEEDFLKCEKAKSVLYEDEVIKEVLETSDFQVMIVAEWHDKATGLIIPLKCLIDIVPRTDSPYAGYLADLKTTSDASPGKWSREVYKWRYHVQAAFYIDMYEAATGEVRNAFAHLLQESFEPFEPGRRMLSEEFIEEGTSKYTNAMAKYCECLKTGKFGGYDDYTFSKFDGFTCVEPEPWMISVGQQ